MSNNANEQINAIHTMLTAGHRNLRMEKHSLWLWGVAGGLLFSISNFILTEKQIPDLKMRAFAWLIFLTLILSAVAIADWHLTHRLKAARDEVWSFIHRQIIKVWWLLMGIGILLSFAVFFFGGGYMLNPAWIILLGLGLFIHGLFSDEILEWAGGSLLIIGILSLCFNLSFHSTKWIAASAFGIGLPLLAMMINQQKTVWLKILYILAWVLIIVLPPILIQRYYIAAAPDAPLISLTKFQSLQSLSGTQIVAIPKDTIIPVNIQVSGDLFQNDQNVVLPLKLNKAVEIVMVDGKPTRQIRFADEDWRNSNNAGWVQIPWIHAELSANAHPVIRTNLIVNLPP
jgi:hypothetical protein